MRVMAMTMLAAGMALATTQAPAQTYGNSGFPVCLQVYGKANYVECTFASIEQCRASAAARAAQCIANPYFASASMPYPELYAHHRRHYRY